jgi:hypothetical protein
MTAGLIMKPQQMREILKQTLDDRRLSRTERTALDQDNTTLLTGSYNWTRSAAHDNEENFLITGDPRFVAAFGRQFERLWKTLHS